MSQAIAAAYLVSAICFMYGLKRMGSPATARSGNAIAAAGMLLCVVVTLLDQRILRFEAILAGIVVGGAVGAIGARAVKMTAMPQMVALFNGMGGGAAALVSAIEFLEARPGELRLDAAITIALSALIGCISFSGSLIAFGKLQAILPGRPIVYPLQRPINALVFTLVVALAAYLIVGPAGLPELAALLGVALVFGVAIVLPIGGADMPVVISLLNSLTGLAVAAAGFVLQNNLLIISGTLVGASGTILTRLMSKAMNRPLSNVLFGAFGQVKTALGPSGNGRYPSDVSVREVTPEDAAALLAYARRVVIVPGYGLAVAQAQHNVRELADLLQKRGVEVRYGIHPVAGRMPGHMNVLLAEANVPYPQLYDMEAINPEFPRTDVALVIGANDVTNPAARESPGSPIYGMPILNVDEAANVIVIKRSLAPGFAGIDNELYLNPKCSMLFGDAREALTKLVAEIKAA